MPIKVLAFYLLSLSLLTQCAYVDPKKALLRSWQIASLQDLSSDSLGTQSPKPALNLIEQGIQIIYHFKPDGTYTIEKGKQEDRGKWQLSENKKVLLLQSDVNPQDNVEFWVKSFTKNKITLLTNSGPSREKIILQPYP